MFKPPFENALRTQSDAFSTLHQHIVSESRADVLAPRENAEQMTLFLYSVCFFLLVLFLLFALVGVHAHLFACAGIDATPKTSSARVPADVCLPVCLLHG